MTQTLLVRLAAALCASLLPATCPTHADGQAPTVSEAAARAVRVAVAHGAAGELAVLDLDGRSAGRAFGRADRATGRRHQAGATWLWASVTKQVTAVLVMQEVAAGRLALDSAITRYLVDFRGSTGARVTLRQLLQHVSGLPNPDATPRDARGVPSFYTERGAGIADVARALGFCAGTEAVAPGGTFSYNNCDYLVLGAILERVTGRPYDRLVAERIATPLGLASPHLARDGALRGGGAAVGYTERGRRHPPINVATYGAAGALVGTALDLLAFDRALMAGRLLDTASRQVLWTGDAALGYEALGAWAFEAPLRGCAAPVRLIERRGDVAGIQVRNVIAPDVGRAVVLFVNDDTTDFGEVWQGRGLTYDLLAATLCPRR